ncbi:uncharacterized protein LOC122843309 [Gambusia affinis]|uniref:uncharacterized protein LOC122843309 n=1 Tax=Gambusia affinis TaxID=33528 RepID=UPI001CDD6348|nr:uncharacterized protein LOC122843309 [Gambusia affinis]
MLSATVEGKHTDFLVDTGATHSTLNSDPPFSLTSRTVSLTGFLGTEQSLLFTMPLTFILVNQNMKHSFVSSPTTPMNLLGRHLLIKMGATIMCSADGIIVAFPDGTSLLCGNFQTEGQYLIQPVVSEFADIYWELLTNLPYSSLKSTFVAWKPWLLCLRFCVPPPDPPCVALFCDRDVSEWYQEPLLSTLEETTWQVKVSDIYVAPVGVAAVVPFAEKQSEWYSMSHISLCLHPEHQVKELGVMMKRSLAATDSIATAALGLFFSRSLEKYKISHSGSHHIINLKVKCTTIFHKFVTLGILMRLLAL